MRNPSNHDRGRHPDVLGFTHADRMFAVEGEGVERGEFRGIRLKCVVHNIKRAVTS